MWHSLYPVAVISRREVRDQLRDWRITTPLVILTLFFPILIQFTARQMVGFVKTQGGADILFERLFPFLLMVVGFFPITVSLGIALESFAGETERRSIEPLLDTPLSDWQLYFGKLIAGIFASVTASYLGLTVYIAGLSYSVNWLPPLELLVQILILAFVQALVMVSGAVVVSTQTTSVRAANLLASFIIIPMALLLQVESVIMFWGDYGILWWVIAGQVVVAGLLVRTGLAHFNREDLLGRELDAINLRAGWHNFAKAFVGGAKNPWQWYRQEVGGAMRKLLMPSVLMIPLIIASFAIGAQLSGTIAASEDISGWTSVLTDRDVIESLRESGFISLPMVFLLWLNNLKSVLIVSLLGIISFGIVGTLGLMLTPATLGFITGLAAKAGISPWLLASAFFIPHGSLEIPAIIISGAAILRVGTTMVTPAKDKSIGTAWLIALADWAKVVLGVVVPLFFLAALVEVFITPRVAAVVLGL
ncbi:MAG: stage II sporulation protein M [Chloroflexota bacterium]